MKKTQTLEKDAERYVSQLNAVTADASAAWESYTRARWDMDQRFSALARTEDTRWRSAVSALVTTQGQALLAAREWDTWGARIARVHDDHVDSGLTRDQAYQRAEAHGGSAWVIGAAHHYERTLTPLVSQVSEVIEAQRGHLRTVASLTGHLAAA